MNPITHNEAASRFESGEGETLAVGDYVLEESTMIVTHIIVPPALRGQGVASAIAAAIVAHARANALKIVPACAFMAAYMQRHPEHADLLA